MFYIGILMIAVGVGVAFAGYSSDQQAAQALASDYRQRYDYGREFKTEDGVIRYTNGPVKIHPNDPGPPIEQRRALFHSLR